MSEHDDMYIPYSGKFSRGKYLRGFKLFMEKNSLVYTSVPSHKIKSSWVKRGFILTAKTTKIFPLENFPLYSRKSGGV